MLLSELVDLLLLLVFAFPFYFLFAGMISSFVGWGWERSFANSPVTNALVLPYVIVWFATFYVMGRQGYARTLLARERAAQRTFQRFGDQWLGIWSPSDEAINSLAALAPKGPSYEWMCAPDGARGEQPATQDNGRLPMPRLALPSPVVATHLLPDVLPGAARSTLEPVVSMVNRWLEPRWRNKIATALTRTCQGSDLPSAALVFVSPWPLPLAGAVDHPGLPSDVDARLERGVQERTGQLRPALRQLLMTAALEGIQGAVDAVRGDHRPAAPGMLIHTSYFEDPDVGRLIALHISSTATSPATDHHTPADQDIARWLAAHRDAVHAEFRRFFATIS